MYKVGKTDVSTVVQFSGVFYVASVRKMKKKKVSNPIEALKRMFKIKSPN